MTFSVVIPSYNGKEYLKKCLRAVDESTIKSEKVIVVDDSSTDGTAETVKEEFPHIELVRNEKNLGPAAARNRGAKRAEGKHIIFLDNDAVVERGAFENIVKFLEKNYKAGIVGVKIIPERGERVWWNMGHDSNNLREAIGYLVGFLLKLFPNFRLLKRFSMFFILNYWDYDRILKVDWVVETCFGIRRGIFETVDGFDEQFFMFFEGPDLCHRVRRAGWDVYFNPEAIVKHLDSHTHKDKRPKIFIESKYRFYRKHYFYLKSNPLFFWIGEFTKRLFLHLA